MKASRRLAENDIITRGVTVKIQQVAVRGNYKNPSSGSQPLVSEVTINSLFAMISLPVDPWVMSGE
jgi:hypothetical protein